MAQLLMCLDGEADTATVKHLKQCAYCQKRAEELNLLQRKFGRMFYRADCPAPETLGEYHHGQLPIGQESSIRFHLSSCPHCGLELAAIEEWEKEIAGEHQASTASQIVRYLASLVEGGLAPLQASPGLRGDYHEPGQGSVILIYQTELARIALEVSTSPDSPDHRRLAGTVVGQGLPSLTIYIWQGDNLVVSTWVDAERGTFETFPLLPGTYDLSIMGGDIEIRVMKVSM
jgi:hypothetical protein